MRKSPIWLISKDKLQEYVDNSNGIYLILEKLGLSRYSSGGYRMLKKRIADDKIDLIKFKDNQRRFFKEHRDKLQFKARTPEKLLFSETGGHDRGIVKRRIIKDGLIPYVCAVCGLKALWLNKPIVLVLDHINGNNMDNRLTNLRFLCPNCNSQSSTFCGRRKRNIYLCVSCGKEITKGSSHCKKCWVKLNPQNFFKRKVGNRPSKDELAKMINEMPMTHVGKKYGVCDNAIKRWCQDYGIALENRRGYWTKVKYKKV